jgi:hypothetical protein
MNQVDQRITLAQEYLAACRSRSPEQLPTSLLVLEDANLRPHLGQAGRPSQRRTIVARPPNGIGWVIALRL